MKHGYCESAKSSGNTSFTAGGAVSRVAALAAIWSMLLGGIFWPQLSIGKGTAASKFNCSPSKLSRKETLTLTFGNPHAAELAVIRPDKGYFFLAQRRLKGATASGMPSTLFAGMVSLSIVPNTFSAKQWSVSAPESEMVFNSPGKYRFVLADKLESEDDGSAQSCVIEVVD